MKYITTWSMTPYLNGSGSGWMKDEQLLASMVTSLRRAHKWLGEKPEVYTDTLTAECLRDLTDDAIINEKLEGLYENDRIPHTLWSYSKLKTLSYQTEPYIHFDLDLFFRKNLDPKFLECDLLIQCYDDMNLMKRDIPEHLKVIYNYETIRDLYEWDGFWDRDWYEWHGANLGILGMNNMDLHNRYIELIFGWIEKNRDAMNYHPAYVPNPTFFEQQPMVVLADEMGMKTNYMFPNSTEWPPICPTFAHFVGPYKDGSHDTMQRLRSLYVDPYITDRVKYHTKKIQAHKK